mmetsp:Transcript_8125/g.32486  ORF Transcript_8125/g.32486 Transcript_8125/m.32486 type:complete len:348 (+) Transcript_8125:2122-3165(+)
MATANGSSASVAKSYTYPPSAVKDHRCSTVSKSQHATFLSKLVLQHVSSAISMVNTVRVCATSLGPNVFASVTSSTPSPNFKGTRHESKSPPCPDVTNSTHSLSPLSSRLARGDHATATHTRPRCASLSAAFGFGNLNSCVFTSLSPSKAHIVTRLSRLPTAKRSFVSPSLTPPVVHASDVISPYPLAATRCVAPLLALSAHTVPFAPPTAITSPTAAMHVIGPSIALYAHVGDPFPSTRQTATVPSRHPLATSPAPRAHVAVTSCLCPPVIVFPTNAIARASSVLKTLSAHPHTTTSRAPPPSSSSPSRVSLVVAAHTASARAFVPTSPRTAPVSPSSTHTALSDA